MKVILNLCAKDLKLFVVDRKAMLITFAVPIMIALFFSLIMGGSSDQKAERIKFLVVDLDGSLVSKAIVAELKKSKQVEPIASEESPARNQVSTGKQSVAMILPKGFGEAAKTALFAGDVPVVTMLFDPSKKFDMQIIQGAFMQSSMAQISREAFSGTGAEENFQKWRDSVKDPKQREAIDTLRKALPQAQGQGTGAGSLRTPFDLKEEPVVAEGSTIDEVQANRGHIFAGMAVQGLLFFSIESAMAILRDKRTGVWRRLRAAPISRRGLIGGRLLSATLISALVGAGVFAFGMIVLGVRVSGTWAGFALTLGCASLMTASFGLLVASLGRTEAQSRGFSIMAVMVMSMLGGAWFPTFLMPKFMQTVSLVIPVRYAVDGFDASTWRGLGVGATTGSAAMLLLFAGIFCAVAISRFRWDD